MILLIQNIPKGKIFTYGRIAKLAGNPNGARQVSWLLHSSTSKHNLPWHRVINSQGKIALKSQNGQEHQKILLEKEGVEIGPTNKIDLKKYLWEIKSLENLKYL